MPDEDTPPEVQPERSAHELEFSPSSMVDDFDGLLREYSTASERARSRFPNLTLAYGAGDDELVDVFPAGDGFVSVFIHGGYWQRLSRREASFPAAGYSERGVTYAAPGYTLPPRASLSEIVDQARRAVAFLAKTLVGPDGSPRPIIISGSSAGAHLAAMVCLSDWDELGLDESPIAGAVLLSGVYDLRPLVETYINDPLGLDVSEAWRLSPQRLIDEGSSLPTALIAVGEIETASFHAQTHRLVVSSGARFDAQELIVAGRNHFDIVHDLSDETTTLGADVLALEREVLR